MSVTMSPAKQKAMLDAARRASAGVPLPPYASKSAEIVYNRTLDIGPNNKEMTRDQRIRRANVVEGGGGRSRRRRKNKKSKKTERRRRR